MPATGATLPLPSRQPGHIAAVGCLCPRVLQNRAALAATLVARCLRCTQDDRTERVG